MNKVISMNLNGNAYQLDESGYAALSAYLEQASSRLAGNPDEAEILADLEQAIADKLQRFISAHKSVITSSEVDIVIKEMGPVSENESESDQAAQTTAGPKRLYRIPEGEVIAGVANGLAVYFDMDVTLVRIIMIILLFATGGGFVFGYLLAWIFIPIAHTQEQRAKAEGVLFNAEELIARTRANIERGRTEGMKHWKAWKQQSRRERKAYQRAYKDIWRKDSWHHGANSGSTLGELFGLTAFIFFVWLANRHVPEVHQFLESLWMFVHYIGNGIAQLILSLQDAR